MSALLEELTLLSHEGANGRAGAYLGLGGAVLYELALAGRIGLDGKKELKAFAEAHWVGAATRRAVGNRDGANAAATSG